MNVREAIESLSYLISGECTDTQMDYVEEIEMAISALEKQAPKKPHRNYERFNAMWCACGAYLGFKKDGKLFCPQCGQRIDWSGVR